MPTDCRVVLQLQAECFRTQDDATMKVASTNATPSTHSPIDGRNIAPPVSVPDRGGRSLQTPSWMSVVTGPVKKHTRRKARPPKPVKIHSGPFSEGRQGGY